MAPALTNEERERIVILRRQGYLVSEIHQITGISRKTVYRWLSQWQKAGNLIPQRRQKESYERSTTAEEDAAIIAAHSEDPTLSTRVLSCKYNISTDTVRRRLKEAKRKHSLDAKRKSERERLMKCVQEAQKNYVLEPPSNLVQEAQIECLQDSQINCVLAIEYDVPLPTPEELPLLPEKPPSPPVANPLPAPEEEIKMEVLTCDICNEVINEKRNFLFVCLECASFDICKKCFNKGKHGHHFVLRIPKTKHPENTLKVVSSLRDHLLKQADQGTDDPQNTVHLDEEEQNVPDADVQFSGMESGQVLQTNMGAGSMSIAGMGDGHVPDLTHDEPTMPIKMEPPCEPDPLMTRTMLQALLESNSPRPLSLRGKPYKDVTQFRIKQEAPEDDYHDLTGSHHSGKKKRTVNHRPPRTSQPPATAHTVYTHKKRGLSDGCEPGPSSKVKRARTKHKKVTSESSEVGNVASEGDGTILTHPVEEP